MTDYNLILLGLVGFVVGQVAGVALYTALLLLRHRRGTGRK